MMRRKKDEATMEKEEERKSGREKREGKRERGNMRIMDWRRREDKEEPERNGRGGN